MHRILSGLDARQRYLFLLLADFGTAVFSAKLIVHLIGLFLSAGEAFYQLPIISQTSSDYMATY